MQKHDVYWCVLFRCHEDPWRGSNMFQLVMFLPDWISLNLAAWYTGKRPAACLGCASRTSCWSSCTCWNWSSSSRSALSLGEMLMVPLGLRYRFCSGACHVSHVVVFTCFHWVVWIFSWGSCEFDHVQLLHDITSDYKILHIIIWF